MKRLKWAVALVILCFALGAIILVVDGSSDRVASADVGLVLGNKVDLDGVPSIALKARLDKAIELYKADYFPKIFVSGGFGKEGYDEAFVMKAYLVEHGIPSDRIIMDSQGDTTYLTAKHTACFMHSQAFTKVLVISQYFHLSRCRLALSRFHIPTIYTAHASLFLLRDFYSLFREIIGFGYYMIRAFPKDPC